MDTKVPPTSSKVWKKGDLHFKTSTNFKLDDNFNSKFPKPIIHLTKIWPWIISLCFWRQRWSLACEPHEPGRGYLPTVQASSHYHCSRGVWSTRISKAKWRDGKGKREMVIYSSKSLKKKCVLGTNYHLVVLWYVITTLFRKFLVYADAYYYLYVLGYQILRCKVDKYLKIFGMK